MKKLSLFLLLVLAGFCWGCKKDSEAEPSVPIKQHDIAVESIIGTTTGGITPSRKGFINLADGVAYSQPEAIANSDKVDFAYNYRGGGCSTCRFFENVKSMSTRTGYVSQFSTLTDSRLSNVEQQKKFTVAAFDSIATVADFDQFVQRYALKTDQYYTTADVTNRVSDLAVGRVFGFVDKNGKHGLFKIGNYTASVPTGDRAALTITVKIKP
ncbi:hypothetical protein ACFPMF_12990 [Larkinella bovis]|uniref:DUF4270 family protein n=1 Tax=Larkinella bovis TaxID=683041 RepID=A0ABW0I9Q7_9BACT